MAFDIDMIKSVYARLENNIEKTRNLLGRPLTLTEKVLYNHLAENHPSSPYKKCINL